jgi:chromosome partitioning protein
MKKAHVIVLGNEKGGSGKTTTAMHLIISLLKLGYRVGSIDTDPRQQSLTRYIENRKSISSKRQLNLAVPDHMTLRRSSSTSVELANAEEEREFLNAYEQMAGSCDFVVIDTPGSDTFLSRLAHSYADTLITPINDSFVDLDLIGKVQGGNLNNISPGVYSAMLWEQKMQRAKRDQAEINWLVLRNRLSTLDAINKRNVEQALALLAKKFGFRVMPGFGDRVIFKELFIYGLTLHDIGLTDEVRTSTSMLAARQELRDFLKALMIQELTEKIDEAANE